MAKASGLGMRFYADGHDISGDVGSIQTLRTSRAELDDTGLDKSAHERLPGIRDGEVQFNAFYNPSLLPDASQAVLDDLPSTDVICMVCFRAILGADVGIIIGKRLETTHNRGANGSLELTSHVRANGHGLDAGVLLTAGRRSDTAAANGSSVDGGAATAFGWSAALEVFDFAGTSAAVVLQDSADNVTFADVAGGTFTTITAAPAAEYRSGSPTATLRRYTRAKSQTGTAFTLLDFAFGLSRYAAAHAGD
jgi:hypothetical protein